MAIEISQKEYPTKSPDWSIIESPEAANAAWPENRPIMANSVVNICFIYFPCIGGLNVFFRLFRFRSLHCTTFYKKWFNKTSNELSRLKLRSKFWRGLTSCNA